jgi:hypothetical protein
MGGASGDKGSGAEGEREKPVPCTGKTTMVAGTASPKVAGGSMNFLFFWDFQGTSRASPPPLPGPLPRGLLTRVRPETSSSPGASGRPPVLVGSPGAAGPRVAGSRHGPRSRARARIPEVHHRITDCEAEKRSLTAVGRCDFHPGIFPLIRMMPGVVNIPVRRRSEKEKIQPCQKIDPGVS